MKEGKKFDSEKLNWNLIPFDALEKIVEVLNFGAKKYEAENWKKLDHAMERYSAALLRHFTAWKKGEIIDQDSGLSHLSHIGCNALFMIWFEINGGEH